MLKYLTESELYNEEITEVMQTRHCCAFLTRRADGSVHIMHICQVGFVSGRWVNLTSPQNVHDFKNRRVVWLQTASYLSQYFCLN